jgi:hypothetical protein
MSTNINKTGGLYFNRPQVSLGGFKLEPGEQLPKEMLERLNAINKSYSKSRNFSQYSLELEQLFDLTPKKVTEESKRFLGGFVEGEASLNVSAKKLKTAQFGVLIDPEFSLTQHVNGFTHLHQVLKIFQTGRIRHKAGSNATLVFILDNRTSLEQKVVPFYESYVAPFASPAKVLRLQRFKELLRLFNEDKHRDFRGFLEELLPLWDSMRMQRGQSNETFSDLQEAQAFVVSFCRHKQTK